MSEGIKTYFENQLVNGESDWFLSEGRLNTVFVLGNLDGGAVVFDIAKDKDDPATVVEVTELTFTVAGAKNERTGAGVWIRARLAGAGASADVTAWGIG